MRLSRKSCTQLSGETNHRVGIPYEVVATFRRALRSLFGTEEEFRQTRTTGVVETLRARKLPRKTCAPTYKQARVQTQPLARGNYVSVGKSAFNPSLHTPIERFRSPIYTRHQPIVQVPGRSSYLPVSYTAHPSSSDSRSRKFTPKHRASSQGSLLSRSQKGSCIHFTFASRLPTPGLSHRPQAPPHVLKFSAIDP